MSFDSALSVAGAVVPVMSAIASFVNHIIRVQVESGAAPHPFLLAFGSFLNFGAVNVDKSVQLAKMARGLGALGVKEEEKKE